MSKLQSAEQLLNDPLLRRRAQQLRLNAQRRRVSQLPGGRPHWAPRNRGTEFDEVRPYQPGDLARDLHAPTSVRRGSPYVKQMSDPPQQIFWILINQGATLQFGSTSRTKAEQGRRAAICLTLAMIGLQHRVGIIRYGITGSLEITPAQADRRQPHRIAHLLCSNSSMDETSQTILTAEALSVLYQQTSRSGPIHVILIDDFLVDFSATKLTLSQCPQHHSISALMIEDPLERVLPKGGLMAFADASTSTPLMIDARNGRYRDHYKKESQRRRDETAAGLRQVLASTTFLSTDDPHLSGLGQIKL